MKRIIALYERGWQNRSLYGYFQGWFLVGVYTKNPSFTMRIEKAAVFDEQHQEEMNDIINSLKTRIGYSELLIKAEEIVL